MAIITPGAVDYHLACQSGGNLSINPQSPISLMCWLNATWNGGARISMIGAYNSATSGGTAIQFGTSAGTGDCAIWTWGGTVLCTTATGLMTNGVWYHIGYTYDGTTHTIYVNGVSQGTSTTAQLAGTITSMYVNGYPTGGTSETGTFSVGDIRYFNRALSAAEVGTAYVSAGKRDGLDYGIVANMLLNEGSIGTTANLCLDYSGNGNSLTPIGAATGVNFTYTTGMAGLNERMPL